MSKCTRSLYSKPLEQETNFAYLNTQFTCFDSVCGSLITTKPCISTKFVVRTCYVVSLPGEILCLTLLPESFTIYYTDFCKMDCIPVFQECVFVVVVVSIFGTEPLASLHNANKIRSEGWLKSVSLCWKKISSTLTKLINQTVILMYFH